MACNPCPVSRDGRFQGRIILPADNIGPRRHNLRYFSCGVFKDRFMKQLLLPPCSARHQVFTTNDGALDIENGREAELS